MVGDFFQTLRRLYRTGMDMTEADIKVIYKALMAETMMKDDLQPKDKLADIGCLRPLKCEIANPDADWSKIWTRVRIQGLGPNLT